MKEMILILLSIAMGLLLGRYYSLIPRKLLMEYILAVYLSVKFKSSDGGNLVTVKR
jgi:hypothetical protein